MRNIICIIVLISGSPTAAMTLRNYTEEDLVLTRIAWGHHERRLRSLVFDAESIALNHITEYFCGVRHIATIDANKRAIITHLNAQESVELSYEDFRWLITNERILALANERFARERQSRR